MNRILSLIFLLIFASCVNKGLIETNQKKIYLSNTKILYDMKKSSFKMDFSINYVIYIIIVHPHCSNYRFLLLLNYQTIILIKYALLLEQFKHYSFAMHLKNR